MQRFSGRVHGRFGRTGRSVAVAWLGIACFDNSALQARSEDYRLATSTPTINAIISAGSGASRTMPRTTWVQCCSGTRFGDLISGVGVMPHSEASSAISLKASRTPSRTRKMAASALARRKQHHRRDGRTQGHLAVALQPDRFLGVGRHRKYLTAPNALQSEVARDGECHRRAQDQRGYRAGHAAREIGPRQVPGHDFAPCSAWQWRGGGVGSCATGESRTPAISAGARSAPPSPRRSGCRRSRATG